MYGLTDTSNSLHPHQCQISLSEPSACGSDRPVRSIVSAHLRLSTESLTIRIHKILCNRKGPAQKGNTAVLEFHSPSDYCVLETFARNGSDLHLGSAIRHGEKRDGFPSVVKNPSIILNERRLTRQPLELSNLKKATLCSDTSTHTLQNVQQNSQSRIAIVVHDKTKQVRYRGQPSGTVFATAIRV